MKFINDEKDRMSGWKKISNQILAPENKDTLIKSMIQHKQEDIIHNKM